MTGLKLLADQVDAKLMSRAVTGHAASIGISGAVSYLLGDVLAEHFGWRVGVRDLRLHGRHRLADGGLRRAVAAARRRASRRRAAALFDFRPVLRNTSAFAYSVVYCVHTLEMSALRGWGVAFLAFVAGTPASATRRCRRRWSSPCWRLLGTLASVVGNEASIRFGRRRLVAAAMVLSICFAADRGLRSARPATGSPWSC